MWPIMSYVDRSHTRGLGYQASRRDGDGRAASMELAAKAIRTAEHICVLTGAGISAESGVPTFRDALTGLWSRYDAEQLATPDAFRSNPDLVWSWYAMRAAQVRGVQPNAGHHALAALALSVPHFTLITQNVDDLHSRAGNHDVVSLHGTLLQARCSAGCAGTIDFADTLGNRAPPCARCGALMRPDVVWFGEALGTDTLARARAATFACDVFLSVGTSNVVEPAASLPWLAAAHGATVIVVNTSMEGQRQGPSIVSLSGLAGSVLSRLVSLAFAGRKPRVRDE
jgi:NAD-dependent deacetylase